MRTMEEILAHLGLQVSLIGERIVVAANTLEETCTLLDQVLGTLEKHGFTPKGAECNFMKKKSLTLPGVIVSKEGCTADPQLTRTVTTWPTPASQRQLANWLEFIEQYQHAIRDFGEHVRPLIALSMGGGEFEWEETHSQAFQDL